MSYALNTDGIQFPPIPTQYDPNWNLQAVNTFNAWAVDVSNIIANITGVENIECLSEITCCAGTVTSGFIGGWTIGETAIYSTNMCLDNANEMITVGNAQGVHIEIDGTNDRIRTSDFASGAMGTGWQVATDITEFQNIRARGVFTTAVFEKQSVSSVGGSLLIRDADVLAADMTALDSSCLCLKGDATFAVDDVLRIKHGSEDEWLKVTCVEGNAYCVERDKEGSYGADSNPTWTNGTAVINYGASGEGGIVMTSAENCSPYIGIYTHAGSPWSTITNRARLGNLDGISSANFGAMSGYGLWAEGAYIEGSIVACNIRLQDPACADNYSCLDDGALKFHDKLGDVPYVKRICSGNACSGDTIILNGWTAAPEVMTSINSMKSYDCTQAAVSQYWSVFADTPVWYCTSPTCYGYCFDVHATLTTEGTKCTACVHNADFDACVLTYANVGSSSMGMRFQLWCNPDGVDQCYSYGTVCYEICYRCNGCGSWQGSCCYVYEQTHDSSVNLKSDCTVYHNVVLPSCECWELMATQTCFTWTATDIAAGGTCSGTCTRTFSGTYCCFEFYCYDGGVYCYQDAGISLGLTGSNPDGITCNTLHYNWCAAGAGEGNAWFFCIGNYGGAQRWTCWESYIKADSTTATSKTRCFQVENNNCITCCNWSANSSVDLGHTNDVSNVYLCMCLKSCIENTYGWAWSTNEMCVVGGCLVQCYSVCCAGADVCCYRKLYSTCDTTGTCCVLDASGQVNWLAISYS